MSDELPRMKDDQTTIAQLRSQVAQFVEERDWNQFHAPKNLVMALTIEAGELMEHFQWISEAESRTLHDDPQRLAEVAEEIADVFCYTLALANELDLDLAEAFQRKMVKNCKKYPAHQYRGRYGANDPSPVTPAPDDS